MSSKSLRRIHVMKNIVVPFKKIFIYIGLLVFIYICWVIYKSTYFVDKDRLIKNYIDSDLKLISGLIDKFELDSYSSNGIKRVGVDILEKKFTTPPKDPWGNFYLLESAEGSIKVFTLGKDGVEGGEEENQDIELQILHVDK